jgi:hypothetical protein
MRDVTPLLTSNRAVRGAYHARVKTLFEQWFSFAGDQPHRFELHLGPAPQPPCYGHYAGAPQGGGLSWGPEMGDKDVTVKVSTQRSIPGQWPDVTVKVDLPHAHFILNPETSQAWGAVFDRFLYLKLKKRSRTPFTLLSKAPLRMGEQLILTRGPEGTSGTDTSVTLPHLRLRHVCGERVTVLNAAQVTLTLERVRLGGQGVGVRLREAHANAGAAQTSYVPGAGTGATVKDVVMQSFLTMPETLDDLGTPAESMPPYTAAGELGHTPAVKEGSGFVDLMMVTGAQLTFRLDAPSVRSVVHAVQETFSPVL